MKTVERTGNNVLTTEELAIGYRTKELASGINISLHRGEVLGIIGANGTGKTTFLKTVLGDIRELGGRNADRSSVEARAGPSRCADRSPG